MIQRKAQLRQHIHCAVIRTKNPGYLEPIVSPRVILAFGASGKFAGLAVTALASHEGTVREFVKNEQEAALARGYGVHEIALGDLNERESIDRALRGVGAVFYLAPAFMPKYSQVGKTSLRPYQGRHRHLPSRRGAALATAAS